LIRLILFGALLFALAAIIRMYRNTPPAQRRHLRWRLGLAVAALMLILLALTGRVHWLGAVFGALLPLLLRWGPLLMSHLPTLRRHYRQHRGPGPTADGGQRSEVKSEHLRMVLDHDSQQLSGEVIAGPYAGSSLESLSLEQLQTLLDYLQNRDSESIKLLVSYLNHRFGPQWQQARSDGGPGASPAGSGPASRDEALAILGLTGQPSREAIIQAHRKLIQKVHPDRGGNDYLAAQINRAKDILLGE
jgi:hypothetical protein